MSKKTFREVVLESFSMTEDVMDLRFLWDSVLKFNTLAGKANVSEEEQLKLVNEELKELESATSARNFLKEVIDSLFVIAPLVERQYFIDYIPTKEKVFDGKADTCMEMIPILMYYLKNSSYIHPYRHCIDRVIESNLSKFIKEGEGDLGKLLSEVLGKNPDIEVAVVESEFEGEKYYHFQNKATQKVLKDHSHYKACEILS